jgi:sulfoquinovosidase
METITQSKYALPLVGIWLQDWVGLRHAYDGDRLLWNWRLDSNYYPNWNSMVRSWSKLGVRVLSYINPFFSSNPNKLNDRMNKASGVEDSVTSLSRSSDHNCTFLCDERISHNEDLRDIFEEGLKNRYFLYSQDDPNHPYILRSGSIEFHMLDFTNPSARTWMKDVIKYEMIAKGLSSGWMADFAEYAPFDVSLYDVSRYASNDTDLHSGKLIFCVIAQYIIFYINMLVIN